MATSFRFSSVILVFFVAFLNACNLWGANMKAEDFFYSKELDLVRAVEKKDKNKAQNLISEGLTLNMHGDEGITPLFWLIIQKNHEAIRLALELGADPNFKDPKGDSPVTFVSGGNDDELLRLMLEHGGNPNDTDRNGQPALFGAIGHERWSQIRMLIEYGANPDLTDNSGVTSTHYAAILNKYEIVHFLIEQGSDFKTRDTAGGDIAWTIHNRLDKGLLSPEFPAYDWALKVKDQLQARGVEFPPPSPREIRIQEGRPNRWDKKAMEKADREQ